MILVVGTGSGKKENLTIDAFNAIKSAENLVLKTEKMPVLETVLQTFAIYIIYYACMRFTRYGIAFSNSTA